MQGNPEEQQTSGEVLVVDSARAGSGQARADSKDQGDAARCPTGSEKAACQ